MVAECFLAGCGMVLGWLRDGSGLVAGCLASISSCIAQPDLDTLAVPGHFGLKRELWLIRSIACSQILINLGVVRHCPLSTCALQFFAAVLRICRGSIAWLWAPLQVATESLIPSKEKRSHRKMTIPEWLSLVTGFLIGRLSITLNKRDLHRIRGVSLPKQFRKSGTGHGMSACWYRGVLG